MLLNLCVNHDALMHYLNYQTTKHRGDRDIPVKTDRRG